MSNERLDWVGAGRMQIDDDPHKQIDIKNGIHTLVDQAIAGTIVALQTQYEVAQRDVNGAIELDETGRYRLLIEWQKTP